MNLILLEASQLISDSDARLSERQAQHVLNILRGAEGDYVSVGLLNGKIGRGRIEIKSPSLIFLRELTLTDNAPPPLPLTLILALPRPQMLKRILQTVSMFGLESLILIHSNRVEKSFWQSPSATEKAIREQLILGLEQAKDTRLPEVHHFKRFREFIEDHCPEFSHRREKYVAHPGLYPICPCAQAKQASIIAIGPEGGFTEFEMGMWQKAEFNPVQLGPRILKVETAVTSVLARWL